MTYPSLEACNNRLNWTFATSGLYSWSLCSWFCPGWPGWTWTTFQGPSQSWFLWFSDTWDIHCSHWSDEFSASLKNQSQHMLITAPELISILANMGKIGCRVGGKLKSIGIQVQACVSPSSCRGMQFFFNSNTHLQKVAGKYTVCLAGEGRKAKCHFALSKGTCSCRCYW